MLPRLGWLCFSVLVFLQALAIKHCVLANTPVCKPEEHGAIGDGLTLDSSAVQKAIEACRGGGLVRFNAGKTYLLAGVVVNGSGLHLEVPPETKLLASAERAHYGRTQDDWYALDFHRCTNCSLTGGGLIRGCAQAFTRAGSKNDGGSTSGNSSSSRTTTSTTKVQITNWVDPSCRARRQCRPRLLGVRDSRDVLIAGVRLADSAFWTLHILRSERVEVRGVAVEGGMDFPNNDGIDIDGSSHVTVSDCNVTTADDAVCIKTTTTATTTRSSSSSGPHPARHILVHNCTLRSKSAAVKLGSESRADMYNITFQHLRVHNSNRGLAIQLRDHGTVRDVTFQHITVSTRRYPAGWWGAGEPLYVTALPRWLGSRVGAVVNVTFRNITATTRGGMVLLAGSPESHLRGVALRDVRVSVQQPATGSASAPGDLPMRFAQAAGGNFFERAAFLLHGRVPEVEEIANTGCVPTAWQLRGSLDLRPGPYGVRPFLAEAPVLMQFARELRFSDVTFVLEHGRAAAATVRLGLGRDPVSVGPASPHSRRTLDAEKDRDNGVPGHGVCAMGMHDPRLRGGGCFRPDPLLCDCFYQELVRHTVQVLAPVRVDVKVQPPSHDATSQWAGTQTAAAHDDELVALPAVWQLPVPRRAGYWLPGHLGEPWVPWGMAGLLALSLITCYVLLVRMAQWRARLPGRKRAY